MCLSESFLPPVRQVYTVVAVSFLLSDSVFVIQAQFVERRASCPLWVVPGVRIGPAQFLLLIPVTHNSGRAGKMTRACCRVRLKRIITSHLYKQSTFICFTLSSVHLAPYDRKTHGNPKPGFAPACTVLINGHTCLYSLFLTVLAFLKSHVFLTFHHGHRVVFQKCLYPELGYRLWRNNHPHLDFQNGNRKHS